MTGDRSRRGASSTSHPRRSRRSRHSGEESSGSGSTGEGVRALAARHGIRPSKSLGQNFLLDPNLARAIVRDAGVGSGSRVLEVGAGLGSLTLALAEAGADEVLAVEFDRLLLPALREAVDGAGAVRIVHADATKLDWGSVLGDRRWIVCGNLPYNVGTSITLDAIEQPGVDRVVVMLQREVGERLVATPGSARREAYGAVSLRVAYRTRAEIVRHVPPEVFWPRPRVGSVVVRLERRAEPPVEVDEDTLWRVVDAAFAERRKTMRNALRRLGLSAGDADDALVRAGVDLSARPEELDLDAFATVVRSMGL